MSPLHRAGAENDSPIDEIGRDDAYPLIRDERACIVTALRLGWWMADAYHHGQHAEPRAFTETRPAVPPAKLSNLTEMSAHRRMRMYLDGVDVALAQIADLTRHTGPVPDTSAARALLPDLGQPDPTDPVPLLLALDDLNVEVLRWAMAANHRVGLAYRLGRSVADTSGPATSHSCCASSAADRSRSADGWTSWPACCRRTRPQWCAGHWPLGRALSTGPATGTRPSRRPPP